MAKQPDNHRQAWTPADERRLRELARKNTPTGLIAYELKRTEAAIYTHASELNVSLKPTNKSPYNRRKK